MCRLFFCWIYYNKFTNLTRIPSDSKHEEKLKRNGTSVAWAAAANRERERGREGVWEKEEKQAEEREGNQAQCDEMLKEIRPKGTLTPVTISLNWRLERVSVSAVGVVTGEKRQFRLQRKHAICDIIWATKAGRSYGSCKPSGFCFSACAPPTGQQRKFWYANVGIEAQINLLTTANLPVIAKPDCTKRTSARLDVFCPLWLCFLSPINS